MEDDQSEGCSKMTNTRARLLIDRHSTDSNHSTQTTPEICEVIIDTHNKQNTSRLRHFTPIRVDNKAAERSRLYRERHREEINQRRREIRQRQQYIHQINTLFNVQNPDEEQATQATSSNQLCPKSHTQRQQRYYERHKDEINKRKRDQRLKKNVLKSIPASPAERNRNYRERNRQEINKRRRHNRLRKQNLQRIHTEYNIDDNDAIEQIADATQND